MSNMPARDLASRPANPPAGAPAGPGGEPAISLPPEPNSVAETGLSISFLADLLLKHIYLAGMASGQELADEVKLPFLNVVDQVLMFLRDEELVEITGSQAGYSERSYEYLITSKGRLKAHEVLERSQYAGPAPVALQTYLDIVQAQALGETVVDEPAIRQAFEGLVIGEELLDQIGPAANSARSIFLYGPPGNGKTTIAEGLARILGGHVLVPYAVEVDGQVIKVFDPLNHQEVPQSKEAHTAAWDGFSARSLETRKDRRWLLCRRPVVSVGGELLLNQLELIFDPVAKVYEAPFQMKANGGVFLIDDFGRQQCRPQDLLNRWIVPLEQKVDYLALQTGKKLQIPFDLLIIFSTNLDPKELVDDAFLRRIRHKIEVPNPTPEQYRAIFQIVSRAKGIAYSDEGLRYLLQEHYIKARRELRCCHPRDLCDQMLDEAKYRHTRPEMSTALIDRACKAYFVTL